MCGWFVGCISDNAVEVTRVNYTIYLYTCTHYLIAFVCSRRRKSERMYIVFIYICAQRLAREWSTVTCVGWIGIVTHVVVYNNGSIFSLIDEPLLFSAGAININFNEGRGNRFFVIIIKTLRIYDTVIFKTFFFISKCYDWNFWRKYRLHDNNL